MELDISATTVMWDAAQNVVERLPWGPTRYAKSIEPYFWYTRFVYDYIVEVTGILLTYSNILDIHIYGHRMLYHPVENFIKLIE